MPVAVAAERTPFPSAIVSYLKSRNGLASAALLNLGTGISWSYNPNVVEPTASIVKVDILAKLLADQQPSGSLPRETVQETATEMIEVSDNDAATVLWGDVGGPDALKSFDIDLGMFHTDPSPCLECKGFAWPGWGLTLTSAEDQVTLLSDFVRPNKWLSSRQRAWGRQLMESVVPSERFGISHGVPPRVTVALKNGWVPFESGLWQVNSIGWVNGDGRDYIAAVLTASDPDEQYGIGTVDNFGAMVYQALGR